MLVFAIDVKIENPRLDLNAKNNAGDAVISAHCKLTVNGIKGKDFDLVAIVKDDKGEWHENSSGRTVKTHYKCNATYASTEWKDIQVYLKHSVLAPKPGKHTYKVYLYVYYNNEWYGGVRAGTYDMTGSGNTKSSGNKTTNRNTSSNASRSNNTSKSNDSHGGVVKSWTSNSGMVKTEYTQYADGTVKTVTHNQCIICHGSGICKICGGLGYTVSRYGYAAGQPQTCVSCYGAKKCTSCSGSGENLMVLWTDKSGNRWGATNGGNTIVNGIVYDRNGRPATSSSSSSSRSSSSSARSSSSSRSSCPKCHGRRFESTAYDYSAASTSGWMQPYHHTGGKCSYCSRVDDHYHNPCSECHGHGQIKN